MKTKIAVLVLVLSGLGGSLFAQNPTAVTGTLTDPGSIAYYPATVSACLTPNTIDPTVGGKHVNPNIGSNYCVGPVPTASNGAFSMSLFANANISPAATQWIFTVQTSAPGPPVGNGPLTFSSAAVTISGTSQDVSTNINSVGTAQLRSSSGSSSWSALTASINSNVGFFKSIQPGTFTSGAHHQAHQRILDGGNATGDTCPDNYNIGGATSNTDAFSACLYTPSSGVTNSFNTAVAGYVQVNDPNQGGQFGKVIGVGGYFVCSTNANNTKCIGAAPQVEDKAGQSGTILEALELGISPFNTTTQGQALLLSTEGATVQPASNQMPAVEVQTPTSTSTFTTGLQCDDAATSSGGSFACVRIGKKATGNGQDSQNIWFSSTTAGAVNNTANFNFSQENYFGFGSQGAVVFNPSGPEVYAVSLTSTSSLTTNQLVKLDTGNAHSVVVCTTADTTACMGFVAGSSGVLCGAAGTFCQIAATPGSKVLGILGTGTCAIGNNVLVDTTTNGRVKCQAGIPAQGAWIGIALSAQVTVGNTVEILTKFQ